MRAYKLIHDGLVLCRWRRFSSDDRALRVFDRWVRRFGARHRTSLGNGGLCKVEASIQNGIAHTGDYVSVFEGVL